MRVVIAIVWEQRGAARELTWCVHDPKIWFSVSALAFNILGTWALVEILLTTHNYSCWLPILIVSNMQIQNTNWIHCPCWQRDMTYTAKHNGFHVRGDFPPPFGRGRSAKEGQEAGQNVGRQCEQLTNLSAGKNRQQHACTCSAVLQRAWSMLVEDTDPGAAPHFCAEP